MEHFPSQKLIHILPEASKKQNQIFKNVDLLKRKYHILSSNKQKALFISDKYKVFVVFITIQRFKINI